MTSFGSITTAPLKLFHGGKSWDGPLELTGGRKGKTENGPGFYLTTSFSTARSYAKGGQRVFEMLVEPDLHWMHDVKVPLHVLVDFVHNAPKLKNRSRVLHEMELYRLRSKREMTDHVNPQLLENLMLEFSNPWGEVGKVLGNYYLSHGIDASLMKKSGEDWVILYNVKKVRSYRAVADGEDSPRIEES